MATIRPRLILGVRDRRGKRVVYREMWSRSFILHFIELLYVQHAHTASTITDVSGTGRSLTLTGARHYDFLYSKPNLRVSSPAGDVPAWIMVGARYVQYNVNTTTSVQWTGEHFGIVVGTGYTPAPATTDNALISQINHGWAVGELEYGGTEVCFLRFGTLDGHRGELTIRRYFTNQSGGTITVCETGIYAIGAQFIESSSHLISSNAWRFCIAHDLTNPGNPEAGISVGDGEVLEVRYVLKITP